MFRYLSVIVLVCLFSLPFHQARAYTILPPSNVVAGKSIAEWTAAWWTWAAQAPNGPVNPQFDPTGASADYNNDGPVFFVAGNTFTRAFTVPAGRPILIPIINFFDIEPDPPVMASLEDRITATTDAVASWLSVVDTGSLFASVDGKAVANPAGYLEVTDIFSMGPVQPGSYLDLGFGIPAGTDASPNKAAGYWLMIDGLTPGVHELHFGGSAGACCGLDPFSSDTTAFISVVTEPTALLLLLPGAIALLSLRLSRQSIKSATTSVG
jgi:hypothetical protein